MLCLSERAWVWIAFQSRFFVVCTDKQSIDTHRLYIFDWSYVLFRRLFWCFFYFLFLNSGPEKLLLKYIQIYCTQRPQSINFPTPLHSQRNSVVVYHSDMRRNKQIWMNKRTQRGEQANNTHNNNSKNFGHNFNLKFCRCHTKLSDTLGARDTFTWVHTNTKNVLWFYAWLSFCEKRKYESTITTTTTAPASKDIW